VPHNDDVAEEFILALIAAWGMPVGLVRAQSGRSRAGRQRHIR